MKRGAALLLLGLLLAPALPAPLPSVGLAPPADAEPAALPDVAYEWWDEAWHMRLPVLLLPQLPDRVHGGLVDLTTDRVPARNYPATVEIDFTQAIRDSDAGGFGWPQDAQGRLSSFTLDLPSVRVVEYDRFKGCMLVRDRATGQNRCFQSGDRLTDGLVPATVSPGLWENPLNANPAFDPERNAVATLQWLVRGAFQAPRQYFVYFDIVENGAKPPPTYRPDDIGPVEGLQWVRAGTDVFGFSPGPLQADGPSVILASALYDNTTIVIYKYTTLNGGIDPAEAIRGTVNALDTQLPENVQWGVCPSTRGYAGTVCLEAPVADRFFFRVVANRPVVVQLMNLQGITEGCPPCSLPAATWYPSRDGGLAGTDFVFRALHNDQTGQGLDTTLRILSPEGTATITCNGAQLATSSWTTCQNGDPPGNLGGVVRITSSRPVLVLSPGITVTGKDTFGQQFVTPAGAPVGAHLVGYLNRDFTLVNPGPADTTLLLGSPLGRPDDLLRIEDQPLPAGTANALHTPGCGCSSGGEVWRYDAKDEVPLWGKAGEAGLIPIGGKHGQEFHLSLQRIIGGTNSPTLSQLVLMGLYNGTRVTITNSSSGAVFLNTTLGLHGWIFRSQAPVPIPYGDWDIRASKPVAAYFWGPQRTGAEGSNEPAPPYMGTFVARSEPPVHAIGAAEFHGFAVGWAEKLRTTAVAPGERVRLKLAVVNLGRGIGGKPLSDDVGITQEVSGPANASAPDVDLSTVLLAGLSSFQSRDVILSVQVPADAATGTVYQVNLTARSRGNPNFADTARIVVTVQIRYEFTLRFAETNATSIQKIIRPDTSTCIDIEARNTGTGDVTLRFQMSPTKKSPAAVGFDPQLLPFVQGTCAPGSLAPWVDADGQPTQALVLRRGEARTLTLHVQAPSDTRPLPLELEIQGTAQEDASVRQQLTATVFTNVDAKLRLTALQDAALIVPSGNVSFRLRVENIGDVETPIEYGTTGLLPHGWNVTFVDAPALLRGRGSVDALGQPLDAAEFTVNLTAAPDAPVGLVVPVNALATSAIIIDTGETSKAFRQSDSVKLTASVANNFTLDQPEASAITINPGEPFVLAYDVGNAANGNFSLRLAPASLPRNWTLAVEEPAGEVPLLRGQRQAVRIAVTPELATKAGPYEVGVAFVTRDAFTQGAQFRNTSILVRSTSDFRVEPDVAGVVLPPGGEREVELRVVNSGNLPIALRLAAQAPAGYQASLTGRVRADLQPGEDTRLSLLLRAPPQASELAQAVRIVATDEHSNKQKDFTLEVQTARLDLAVVDVALSTKDLVVGQPAVVSATLQNTGTVAANNVAVVLLVNGRGVRNETLRTLPPGEPRTVSLPWTVDAPVHDVVVVVDADDKYAEVDESNNQGRAEVARNLPAPALAWLALAMAGALLVRRRGHG